MEVSFSLKYKEGNEIRVSLSSFPETAISDLIERLGGVEIVEVSLVRQRGEDTTDLATLSNIKYIDNQLVTVIKIQMICKCKYKTI